MRKLIDESVDISNLYLAELFDLSDVEVKDHFNCQNNSLTNLIGAPHTVGGDFRCDRNNLTSLIGAPKTVGGNFYCNNNPLTSLEGIPKTIGGNFFIPTELMSMFTACQIRNLSNIIGNITYCIFT
jgi:hypothetical protein